MTFALVVAKVCVSAPDDIPAERVDQIARTLAVALRGAADVVQVGNYDVTITLDGAVTTEAEVRASAMAVRPARGNGRAA